MEKNLEHDVVSVLARRTGLPPERITTDARLVEDLGLDGDEAISALLELSKMYALDVTGFNSSLYFRSEPSLLTVLELLFRRRQRLPKSTLTVEELITAIRRGNLSMP
jgi:acyl carrier protein